MSTFDAEVFAAVVMAEVRSFSLSDEAALLIQGMQVDIEATLAALETERNASRARRLCDNLAAFLPARVAMILAEVNDEDLKVEVELALRTIAAATYVVAQAFMPRGA